MGPNLGPYGMSVVNKNQDIWQRSEVKASEVEKPPGCGNWEVEKQPCGL